MIKVKLVKLQYVKTLKNSISKFHFSIKLYTMKVMIQNYLLHEDLQVLIAKFSKNTIKIQKFNFLSDTTETLRWKIISPNEVYKSSVEHFLTRYIFYVLILNIENQKFHMLINSICFEIQNKR